MITEYIHSALKKAEYRTLDDGSWFAEIPDFYGVWANGKNVESCREELKEVLEEWLILKLRDRETVPTVDGKTITIKEEAAA